MSYDCPHCGSRQTNSFEMTHAHGTRGGHFGAGTVSSGGGGVAGGKFISQSLMASRAAPPVDPKLGCAMPIAMFAMSIILAFIACSLVGRMLGAVGISYDDGGIILFFILVVVFAASGIGWACYDVEVKKMPVFREALDEWERSMVCRHCGWTWVR